ncbi:MAG TPA: ATP-binding protein [Flavobacterium sp.]|nr:ATP-binding protein [Flavobacterium sp.]
MESKKSYIPIKVLVSYVVLAALVIGVGTILYSENIFFSETESKIARENNKILKISTLLSDIHETESLARITIQSNASKDLKNYTRQTDFLILRIDSLKLLVATSYQQKLLDSVKLLLSRKTENILQLKEIKNRASDEAKVKNAISDLTRMELSLRKLRLEDFVKDPASLGAYQRDVLTKYVAYLNQNIPDDNTNTLTQSALDSMLVASKALLNDVKRETRERNNLLNAEEKKLLQNELSISAQLRKILSVIEREIIVNTTKNNDEKEKSLKKIIRIVTIAAVIGLLLTLFFSVLIVSDFSNTQTYKKRLEVANLRTKSLLRNREQLISTVSHDLKTPLNTIIGYSELLGNSSLSQKQSYYNSNIKGSSEYISHLIQDLLDFTQIEAGKIILENKPFSLAAMISEVAKSIRSLHSQKNIDLQINIDEQLHRKILGDAFRLRQILSNIIGNAYKFTESGFVKINAFPNPEITTIIITIEDSGIGIAKDKQELIFEEFTQADENIEKRYGGTGLGLTISRKITEILGGQLTLESEPGKGSVFTIEIPLYFTEEKEEKDNNHIEGQTYTVVVIDDDANLLKLTAEILKQHHFEVFSFTQPESALEFLKGHHVDFIITDIQMPSIDGFGFMKQLKDNHEYRYKNQPVIALTGKANVDLQAYEFAGFTAVVKKPYSPSELIKTISGILTKDASVPFVATAQNLTHASFSLTSLRTFFPNDNAALNEVLQTFISNTKSNLTALETAMKRNDIPEVKMLSHRMSPMFRQISAHEIGDLLENLEQANYSSAEMQDVFKKLIDKIEVLLSDIKAMISNPSHIA